MYQCSELLLSMIDYIWCGLKLLAFVKLAACYCKILYIYIYTLILLNTYKTRMYAFAACATDNFEKKLVVKCGNKSYYLSNIVFLRLFSLFTCIKIKCAKKSFEWLQATCPDYWKPVNLWKKSTFINLKVSAKSIFDPCSIDGK